MNLDGFIKRPVLSTVISVFIVILGILGLISLPISSYPDIAPPTVHGKDTGVTSEVIVQRKQRSFRSAAIKITAVKEHLRLGVTETVDALFYVSYEEDIIVGKALDDRVLNAAVILILIDIDLAEKVSVVGGNFRMGKKHKSDLLLIREVHAVLEFFLLRIHSFRREYQFEISLVDRIHVRQFFRDLR